MAGRKCLPSSRNFWETQIQKSRMYYFLTMLFTCFKDKMKRLLASSFDLSSFDDDKLDKIIDIAMDKNKEVSLDNSKLMYIATSLLSNQTTKILKYFFETPELPPIETSLSTESLTPSTPSARKRATINNFIIEEKFTPPKEEWQETIQYKCDPKHSRVLDKLFSDLKLPLEQVNESVLGNLFLICDSFVKSEEVHTDYLKYLYTYDWIREGLIRLISLHPIKEILFQALNIKKDSDVTNGLLLYQRTDMYKRLLQTFLKSTVIDEVEAILEIFTDLIKDNATIDEAEEIIERVLADAAQLEVLFNALEMEDKASRKCTDIVELLTLVINYINGEYDLDEIASSQTDKTSRSNSLCSTPDKHSTDLSDFYIPVEIVTSNEELNKVNQLLAKKMPTLALYLPQCTEVGSAD
jgi:hypothetical protein